MLKRVLAWLAIIGFIFLILDIIFFKFMIDIAIFVYVIVIAYFLLSNMKSSKNK